MRNRFRTYLGANDAEAGYNLSWGAVFAGLVTFIALFNYFFLNWKCHWIWYDPTECTKST